VQCSSGLRSTFRLVPKRLARSRLSYSLGEPPKPEVFRAAEVYALGSTCGCHDLWIIAIFSIPLRIPDLRHLVPDSKRRHPNAHSAEYSTPVWILRRNKRSLVGLAYSIELFVARSMSLEGFEGKGYRSRLSNAGAPTRIVLARKEREMIRMIADCASPQSIAQRLGLGEIQLRAGLDSVFAKLAMLGRLELLSRKRR